MNVFVRVWMLMCVNVCVYVCIVQRLRSVDGLLKKVMLIVRLCVCVYIRNTVPIGAVK